MDSAETQDGVLDYRAAQEKAVLHFGSQAAVLDIHNQKA